MEKLIPQKKPYVTELEKGKTYAWCSCGKSEKQPFCDGSHKGTEFTPVKFMAEETKKSALCGCKHSQNSYLCDGSHKNL